MGAVTQSPSWGWVLIVDDDDFVRIAVSRALGMLKVASIMASDGHEALEILADCQEPPRLILCDLMMPGLEGDDFVRSIRLKGEPWSKLPVVLMTSSNWIDSDKHFTGTLRKPIDPQAFLAEVAKYLKIPIERD